MGKTYLVFARGNTAKRNNKGPAVPVHNSNSAQNLTEILHLINVDC
jgi:hypothetical protein